MILNVIILAIITLAITVYIELKNIKEKGFDFLKALIGITIALAFLSYPLFDQYQGINKLFCSALYAAQILVLNEDIGLVTTIQAEKGIYYTFVIFTYILYFIAPLLSVTALLSLFENTFTRIKMKFSFKQQYHFFSEINEKTIALANSIIEKNSQAKIIFTCKEKNENEPIINRKFLKIQENINDLDIAKIKKEKIFYFMADDEEANLKESLIFLNKIKLNEKVKIYISNETTEAYMMIDSLMAKLNEQKKKNSDVTKNLLEVEIINETERIVLQRLEDLPIPKIFKQKEVNVLIVGCGKFGRAFLKAITWCFQIVGYSFKIFVVEKNDTDAKNILNLEAPELLKKYPIEFINKSIEEVISQGILDDININYAIINAGNDTNNFNIALALRRYFLQRHLEDVQIDLCIRDYYKSQNISTLRDEGNKEYNFNTFGTIKESYYSNSIINSKIERMAKKLHNLNSYGKSEKDNSYLSEYNRKSSRAGVVHIKYKLYSLLKDEYTGNMDIDLNNYKKYIQDEKNVRILAQNEHIRWVAYMHTDGYKTASISDLEQYYMRLENHKNTLARLHPVLVEHEKLPELAEQMNQLVKRLTGEEGIYNFVKQNDDIVKRLDEIYNEDTKTSNTSVEME